MRYISATAARRNFASTLASVRRGPVVIRRYSSDQAVLFSPQEYARLRDVEVADLQAFCDRVASSAVAKGLTERKLRVLWRS